MERITATLTNIAQTEIEREKDFTPDEMLDFLREQKHFLGVSEGIKRELHRHGDNPDDDKLLPFFVALLKCAGFTTDERKNAKAWLVDGKLPSPRSNYPVRLCFAFRLAGQSALDFLWKVCRVNGFNFRRAEDVIFCYCLETGKSYTDALTLIERYTAYAANEHKFTEMDATKRTYTLRVAFKDLASMSEEVFIEKLFANKKNLIGYCKTAHEEYIKLYNSLKATIGKEITAHQRDHLYTAMDKYDHEPSIYPEIVYAFDKINKSSKFKTSALAGIMDNFPQSRYLSNMFNKPGEATDKEHDKARKAFVLLYFADYALDPPPDGFYADFVIGLNDMLDRCGYAKLYPANPFDWLILNCVKSIDVADPMEGLNPVELFNDVLELLADEVENQMVIE